MEALLNQTVAVVTENLSVELEEKILKFQHDEFELEIPEGFLEKHDLEVSKYNDYLENWEQACQGGHVSVFIFRKKGHLDIHLEVPEPDFSRKFTLVNLTPHRLNLFFRGKEYIVNPSGNVARVSSTSEQVEGMPNGFLKTSFGDVEGLLEAEGNKLFVVSGIVEAQVSNRPDVWSPGKLLRDSEGRPKGAEGLKQT